MGQFFLLTFLCIFLLLFDNGAYPHSCALLHLDICPYERQISRLPIEGWQHQNEPSHIHRRWLLARARQRLAYLELFQPQPKVKSINMLYQVAGKFLEVSFSHSNGCSRKFLGIYRGRAVDSILKPGGPGSKKVPQMKSFTTLTFKLATTGRLPTNYTPKTETIENLGLINMFRLQRVLESL